MEVKDEQQSRALKHDDLITLMLKADVSLRRCEPAILLLKVLHSSIKVIQESVTQKVVINQVELTSRVMERVVVSSTRKVEPLRVTKLVSCARIVSTMMS